MIKFILTFLFIMQSNVAGSKENKFTLYTPTGGDFSIPSTEGTFHTRNVRGKNLVLFFGFSRCPDVCPLTLRNLKRMRDSLSEAQRKNLHILFISVDNKRDDVRNLKNYISKFGQGFEAGTDSDEKLNKIMKLFGARFARVTGTAGNIIIDHTTSLFLINSRGEWVDTLRSDASGSEYADSVSTIDQKTKQNRELKRSIEITELGQSKNCDLGSGICSYKHVDHSEYKVRISPVPVKTERNLHVEVDVNSNGLMPVELDFEGIDVNMGLIRPKLLKAGSQKYKSGFSLPVCELKEMRWKVRLILQDPSGALFSVLFHMKSRD